MDDTREFKINLHAGDSDDADFANDDPDKTGFPGKKAKKSVSGTFLIVLFTFFALGGALTFFYATLNSKIQAINTRGSAGIEGLAAELNAKFSELTQMVSDQNKTYQALQSDLDARLAKISASVSALESNKPGKKELSDAVTGIKMALVPLQDSDRLFNEKMAGISEEIQYLADNLKKVQTGVLNNKKEISTLDAMHIDRVFFEQELEKEREFNQQNMAHTSETLFSEIASLHQQIVELEKKINRATSPPAQKSDAAGQSRETTPSGITAVPKPGDIIEQEIK